MIAVTVGLCLQVRQSPDCWSDGNLLYIGFAVVALGVIVLTRGRLGYRAIATQTPEPSRLPTAAAAVANES